MKKCGERRDSSTLFSAYSWAISWMDQIYSEYMLSTHFTMPLDTHGCVFLWSIKQAMTIHQYPFEYFMMSTLYFILFPFYHYKILHWIIGLRSSQLGGTCTGITPRYSASAECWVRRAEASQEPGHAASGEYCITITIIRLSRAETGHSDHAPSAVIRAQWHHYHYHYCQVCWKQDCHSLLLLPTYRPSNDLINFMLRKFCTNRV